MTPHHFLTKHSFLPQREKVVGDSPRGFTVIEALIVVAVIGVIVTIVTLSFGGLNSSQALDKNTQLVLSVLDEARAKTLSSQEDSQYGVRIEASRIILFRGASYVSSDPENEVEDLHSLVAIRNISLAGGGSSVVFNRLTGATAQFGSFELYLINTPTSYKTVSIARTGVVEEN